MQLRIDAQVEALVRLYRAAEAELQALMQESIASGALGTARYRQQRLQVVQAELAGLQGTAIPEAVGLVTDAYVEGATIAKVDGGFGAGLHREALDVLADQITAGLNDAAERVGRRVEDVFRREGLRVVAAGLIEGATRRDVSGRLREALVRQGVAGFRDRVGRDWGLVSYTEMVARTTTREAVSHGTKNRMVEAGLDLVTISSHKHDRDICSDYDGKTFSLTGATSGYPVLDRLPPFHPRCRHVLTPARQNLEALERAVASA